MSLFDRWFRRATPPAPPPPPTEAEQLGWLREQVERDVRAGFADEDQILTDAAAGFEGGIEPGLLRREAQGALRTALAAHAAEQAGWPAMTDCDRLDATFAALEAQGIVARQHFACCGTCGTAEIGAEMGDDARGYAFYHMQDTEGAVEGGGVFLNFGAVADGEAAALAVGQAIVDAAQANGLATQWNGRWDTRPRVLLEWRRRR